MAFIPAPGIIRATLNWTINSIPGHANVVYFETTAASVTSEVLTDLGQALWNWLNDHAIAQLPNTCICDSFTLRSMDAAIAPLLTYTDDLPVPGSGSTPSLPANVTFAVKIGSGLSGRSVNGRLFWPQLPEAAVSGNSISATSASLIVAAVQELLFLSGTLYEYGLGICSFVHDGAPRTTALFTPALSASYTDLVVDTQRRRLK